MAGRAHQVQSHRDIATRCVLGLADSGAMKEPSPTLSMANLGKHHALQLILLLLALMGAMRLMLLRDSFGEAYFYRKDILQEVLLARAALVEDDPYQPLPQLAYDYLGVRDSQILPHPTPHPPSVIPLVLWMGLVDYRSVAIAWMVLELACLFWIGRSIAQHFMLRPVWVWSAVIALAFVGWHPVTLELVYAQLMIILLVLLCLAMRYLAQDRDVAAGILIGLAVAIKLMAWPLWLLLILRRQWRALFASVACFMCLSVVGVAIIGLDHAMTYYLDVSRTVLGLYRACTYNYSLSTIGWRLFHRTQCDTIIGIVALPLFPGPGLAHMMAWALPAALIACCLIACRNTEDLELQYALMVGACILASPIAWMHYLVLAVVPFVVIVTRLRGSFGEKSRRWRLQLWVLVALTYVPEHTVSAFLGRLGTDEGVRHAGEVVVPFAVGLFTLLPMVALLLLMCLLWLVCRHYVAPPVCGGFQVRAEDRQESSVDDA